MTHLTFSKNLQTLKDNLSVNKYLVPVNVQVLSEARVTKFENLLTNSTLVIDGQILRFVLRVKYGSRGLPEKMSGSDLVWKLDKMMSGPLRRIYLIGASAHVNKQAQEKLAKFYDCECRGISPLIKDGKVSESKHIEQTLAIFKPDVVIVCFGAPQQETWIHEHKFLFRDAKIVMAAGGTLDFVAGLYKRAPSVVQSLGIESLYRLLQEPSKKRLFRIINSAKNLKFAWGKL